MAIVFYWVLLGSYSTMAVSNLELDSAIMQASQQLGYATIRPDQNTTILKKLHMQVCIGLPTGSEYNYDSHTLSHALLCQPGCLEPPPPKLQLFN